MKNIFPSSPRLFLTACFLAVSAAMIVVLDPWQQPVLSGTNNLAAAQANPTPYPCSKPRRRPASYKLPVLDNSPGFLA